MAAGYSHTHTHTHHLDTGHLQYCARRALITFTKIHTRRCRKSPAAAARLNARVLAACAPAHRDNVMCTPICINHTQNIISAHLFRGNFEYYMDIPMSGQYGSSNSRNSSSSNRENPSGPHSTNRRITIYHIFGGLLYRETISKLISVLIYDFAPTHTHTSMHTGPDTIYRTRCGPYTHAHTHSAHIVQICINTCEKCARGIGANHHVAPQFVAGETIGKIVGECCASAWSSSSSSSVRTTRHRLVWCRSTKTFLFGRKLPFVERI